MKILIYQWCSGETEQLIRCLPALHPAAQVDVTDFRFFRLHRMKLPSQRGKVQARLSFMVAKQQAMLMSDDPIICFGTAWFYARWVELCAGVQVNAELKERAFALLGQFDAIYLPLSKPDDGQHGKRICRDVVLPQLQGLPIHDTQELITQLKEQNQWW